MVLEVGKRDKQYALDVVNVILCDLKLEEDPYFKIRNYRMHWIVYFVFAVAFFFASLLFTIYSKSIILGICTGILVFCVVRAYVYIYSSGKIMKDLLNKGHMTYTFSKDGVECDNHEKQKMSFQWDFFRYIKLYGTGIFFIPKKKASHILVIPIQYFNEVRSFIQENGIQLEMYE